MYENKNKTTMHSVTRWRTYETTTTKAKLNDVMWNDGGCRFHNPEAYGHRLINEVYAF